MRLMNSTIVTIRGTKSSESVKHKQYFTHERYYYKYKNIRF